MILDMYITLMSVILAGVGNMFFVKTSFYKTHARPLDGGGKFKDGRRIFGDNKTGVGFAGMVVLCALCQLVWGWACALGGFSQRNQLYAVYGNTWYFNLAAGAVFGLAYMLFELPNSFVKRRLDIPAGKTVMSGARAAFFVVDQIDSLFGVALALALFSPMPVGLYFGYVALGGATHIAVNLLLYTAGIRKNL